MQYHTNNSLFWLLLILLWCAFISIFLFFFKLPENPRVFFFVSNLSLLGFQDFDHVQCESQEECAAISALQADIGRRGRGGDEQSVGRRLVGTVHVGQEPGPYHLQGRSARDSEKSRYLIDQTRKYYLCLFVWILLVVI